MRIGITGVDGLLGWHLRCFLYSRKDMLVRGAGRDVFASPERLKEFAASCDAIVHLAGMNRGPDAEVVATNVALTESLLAACDAAGAAPHIVFSSSTRIFAGTPYGESKKKCAALISEWAVKRGARFTNLVLPNIFGEGGKPFYNSAVSTFCYQLANGQEPKIIEDNEIDILHAQRVAALVFAALEQGNSGELSPKGDIFRVSALLARLKTLAADYSEQIFPDLSSPSDLDLFNTYRSYLFPARYPVSIAKRSDERGSVIEAVKGRVGGQTFFSTTVPGVTRGHHYHTRKIERFLVVKGSALVKVRKLFSRDTAEFRVDGEHPGYIDMPALHTHSITNTGKSELITLFWTNEIFDPEMPDTYPETV